MGDDDDLRAALRKGDFDAAFELLLERYEQTIFDRALLVLRDRALAEDAVQATMVKALRSRDSLDEVRNLQAWLSHVATNVARDLWRSRKRHQVRVERMRHGGAADEAIVDPAALAAGTSDADLAALERCLDELEPLTREAFLRRHRDEARWEEIAMELELDAEALRMRVKRALKGLKRCLERHEVER